MSLHPRFFAVIILLIAAGYYVAGYSLARCLFYIAIGLSISLLMWLVNTFTYSD